MARIRSVHPELCRDRTLVSVSAEAERTFVRLWPHLDDEGRAVDDALLLKSDLYPIHPHVTEADVERDLTELASHGLVIRYVVAGIRYLSAKPDRWAEWQKPRHRYPSKFPGPADDGARPVVPDDVGRASDVGPQPVTSDARRTDVGRGTAVGEGLGSCEGEGGGGATSAQVPQWTDLAAASAPPDFFNEGDEKIAVLVASYGDTAVADAIAQLHAKPGSRFAYSSQMVNSLKVILGPPKVAVPSAYDPIVAAQRKRAELDAEHLASVLAEQAEVQALSREEREAKIAARRSGPGRYVEAS